MKVLLVDDDPEIVDALTVGIRFEWRDSTVLAAQNGEEGLRLFFEHTPDIVVLDVVMPTMNGFDVLREVRRVSAVPVIMLTARQAEANHVRGLDLGADDYIMKPFTILTLLARIRAILRRTDLGVPSTEVGVVGFGDLSIDLGNQRVHIQGEEVGLTPAEYRLLYHLMRNPNRVIPNRTLCERVWGSDWHATANDLKALVHRLRRKIRDDPQHPRYIENQRGMGYRFLGRRDTGHGPSAPTGDRFDTPDSVMTC
jgi:DNA-binding response OmpR family regulator